MEYFNLGSEIIKENCNFSYDFNRTPIKPAILDGGNEIILNNWPANKHIECNINNDISVRIHVLLNKCVLCNCKIEVENHFLSEILAACQDTQSKLIMYFIVNTAFINYFDNSTDSLRSPMFLNQTIYEQTYQFLYNHLNLTPNC